jgi:serine O-acetyltransferase
VFPNLKYDFRREFEKYPTKSRVGKIVEALWSQGLQATVGYRLCRWLVAKRIPVVNILIQRVVELMTGISIPPTAQVGKGLLIEHFGGVVVHSGAKIGDFCTLSHQVTIGSKVPGGKSPVLGNHVYVCAGAKILGDITVGDRCIIGANAVVLHSIPARGIAVGIPAKVVKTMAHPDDHREFFWAEDR